MAAVKLEYIWLDGCTPEPSIRSKTKIWNQKGDGTPKVEQLPGWAFDGSSTQQAEGSNSDCLLKPVRIVPDPDRIDACLAMCEVLTADGETHPSNTRGGWDDDRDMWFGFEQEYVLMKDGLPVGFPLGLRALPALRPSRSRSRPAGPPRARRPRSCPPWREYGSPPSPALR